MASWHYRCMMRVSLLATSTTPLSMSRHDCVSLSVTIKPSNNLPGSFQFQTDSKTLLKMLHHQTDLNGLTLETFRNTLQVSTSAKLHAVPMKEETLKAIGYFID